VNAPIAFTLECLNYLALLQRLQGVKDSVIGRIQVF